ncbi:site-2 protease family protein [Haloarchaeobius iranensis]|uniref:Peptidase family M50 n=1 Tax=Haloarchaeobius iranensis TaxID=996166 RepID=A0A1G9T984_9EURY|nr:site-2 protease family protein [Haloarchaeobius iranensis]SDM43665.1 Peptidase family M50 [Haloarchaeobius iranensis]
MSPFDSVLRRFEAVEAACNERLPESLKVGFLTLYAFTTRGEPLVDRVAERGPWRRWHDLGVGVLVACGLGAVGAVGWVAVVALTTDVESTAANDPNNMVAIPGVNEFMPLAAAGYVVLGLLVATLVHEGGHAISLRVDDLPIDEMGVALLFGVLPLAAYVKPTAAVEDAPARARLRLFAAGVANNVAVTLLVLLGFVVVGPDTIVDAYLVYFGWLYTPAAPPTAADVATLGVVGNTLFWVGFLNANLALFNALPIWPLDGGKVFRIVVAETVGDGADAPRSVVVTASALTAAVVLLALFGPSL